MIQSCKAHFIFVQSFLRYLCVCEKSETFISNFSRTKTKVYKHRRLVRINTISVLLFFNIIWTEKCQWNSLSPLTCLTGGPHYLLCITLIETTALKILHWNLHTMGTIQKCDVLFLKHKRHNFKLYNILRKSCLLFKM